PEPDHAMAYALRRAWRHDLLACRAQLAVHSFATQIPILLRGRLDDRGGGPSLHRDGSRAAVRRLPRPKHDRLRVLPVAGFPAHAAAEGDPCTEAAQARCGTRGCLPKPAGHPNKANRWGIDPPEIQSKEHTSELQSRS